MGDQAEPDKASPASSRKPRKTKKVSHACIHCQVSHVVCDEERPCSRCVRRGMGDKCTDGVRKRAKYLLMDDVEQPESGNSPEQHSTPQTNLSPSNGSHPQPFGSEAINLEYSFLSSMLNFLPFDSFAQNPPAPCAAPPTNQQQQQQQQQQHQQQPSASLHHQESPAPILRNNNSLVLAPPLYRNHNRKSSFSGNVYASVTEPYNYIEGFHYLVKYVKERMDRKSIVRICRALVQFRPSFMAQMINLSVEDLIFVEKCFQRTLMEFDKLIGFSGTPTVVWRRTGEIALVGKEFTLLTQWSHESLLGKKTYIYELMDTESAVEYWEKFAAISFDSSQQSCILTATLVSPSKRPVPCSYCFTIKRDIFDVPLAIVGNFLPLFETH